MFFASDMDGDEEVTIPEFESGMDSLLKSYPDIRHDILELAAEGMREHAEAR